MNIQNDIYHQIVNSMTFPLVIIDLQKKITIINISGEDFLRTSSKMLIGKDIRDFMPFSSPIINLIEKCINENSGFNEYGLDLSNPRIGNKKDNKTWKIPAEFNDKKHVKGTLSMARSKEPNSAGSQFFICHAATPQLNNQYTVFGQVIDGLEIIDQIVYSETPRKQNPGYRGPDADYPFEKVEMKIKLVNKSQVLK